MSNEYLRLILTIHLITGYYEVAATNCGYFIEGATLNTAQAAFDYCAEHYPGETVTVDIRPAD